MAEIIQNDSGSKKGGGKRRTPRKMGAGVDMTPMVDLICLLITFFMLTTAFAKPKVMEITMPDKDKPKDETVENKVDANKTYSLILGEDNRLYWYWHKDAPTDGASAPVNMWHKTTYGPEGIRKFLLEKNEITVKEIVELKRRVKAGEEVMSNDTLNARIKAIKKKHTKQSPTILIKAVEKSKYRNLVDIIDEMAICNISSYAVIDPTAEDIELLKSAPK